MKATRLGLTVLSPGIALLMAAWAGFGGSSFPSEWRWLQITLGGVLTTAGAAIALTALGGRSARRGLMRLDIFLPFLIKPKKNSPPSSPSIPLRLAKRLLPSWFFSVPDTRKPGLVRKVLKRLGASVVSSPGRRIVQTICFSLFLFLFFYVCWPYSARPESPGEISEGWRIQSNDQQSGVLQLGNDTSPDLPLKKEQLVHLIDAGRLDPVQGYVAPFVVVQVGENQVGLKPQRELSEDQHTAILLGEGPWSLYEKRPNDWPSHYADDLARKERIDAEIFLAIDPLVSLSTAVAARSWVWSLTCAAIILIVCILIPRGFCGFLCPLGTLIDLFDWAIGKRVERFRLPDDGWWVHIKYYLLTAVMVAAAMGVLVSGYVAAIPVITRGMMFLGEPLQSGMLRSWKQVPPINFGHLVSLVLFFVVLGLGFLKPRFWCKYVCPSGAVFSLGNLFRVSERKVDSTCINCNKCVEICPFDAIKPDFTTRVTDCTLCQTCGGVCPTQAIKFVERWNAVDLKIVNDPPTGETALGRRGFLSLAVSMAAAVTGGVSAAVATKTWGARLDEADSPRPVRPPGSVPETEFLQMCIRCGECYKACPNNVLQPLGFEQGLEGLWTPQVVADHAGCDPSCNACGQVCPTGAIRALPLEEKKAAHMGLAVVDEKTCLPFADREACQLCVDECNQAGYEAIEFVQVGTKVDELGLPIEGTGYTAPVVSPEKCVGCGICQTRCYQINVKQKYLLQESAIIIQAGSGKEDRLMHGKYSELHKPKDQSPTSQGNDSYLPDFTTPPENPPKDPDSNF